MVKADMLSFLVLEAGRPGVIGEEDRDVRFAVFMEILASSEELASHSPGSESPRPQAQFKDYGARRDYHTSSQPSEADEDSESQRDWGIPTESQREWML